VNPYRRVVRGLRSEPEVFQVLHMVIDRLTAEPPSGDAVVARRDGGSDGVDDGLHWCTGWYTSHG
jgi:hypothetical protein